MFSVHVQVRRRIAPGRGVEYFVGYDFQNYSGEDEVLLIAPNTERVHALFGQIRTTPDLIDKTTLAFGARYNAPTNSEAATVWNLTGQYDVTGNLFARANVGTAFRYPDAYELFAADPTCCFGNPNLKPETSTNVNGSVGGRIQTGTTNVTLEAIGFYRTVSDLIVDVDDGSGETTITANRADTVRARGISLVASSAVTTALSGALGYTRIRVRSGRTSWQAGIRALPAYRPTSWKRRLTCIPPRCRWEPGSQSTAWASCSARCLVSARCRAANTRSSTSRAASLSTADGVIASTCDLKIFWTTTTPWASRGFRDAPATPFLVHNLGAPRPFHVSYSFSY